MNKNTLRRIGLSILVTGGALVGAACNKISSGSERVVVEPLKLRSSFSDVYPDYCTVLPGTRIVLGDSYPVSFGSTDGDIGYSITTNDPGCRSGEALKGAIADRTK